MEIKSNKEMVEAVEKVIKESGYKKGWIADQLGISKQALTQFLQKVNFSVDDANRILNVIGYEINATIHKKY